MDRRGDGSWVGGWSQQQLLMDCMQEGAEAEDLEPEPGWEAGKCRGGKLLDSGVRAVGLGMGFYNEPTPQVILGRLSSNSNSEAEFYVYKIIA